MTLRARLATFAAVGVIVTMIVASGLAWLLARNSMLSEIDGRLQDQARLTALVVEQVDEGIRPAPAMLSAIQPVPIGVQMVAPDGTARSPVIGAGIDLPSDDPLRSVLEGRQGSVTSTAVVEDTRWRVVTMPLEDGGAIRVARSLGEFDAAQSRLGVQLGLLALGGGLLSGVAGYVVARAGMKPVADLTTAAERVAETKDLAARITTKGGDEVARLAAALNHMLVELDDARTRQWQLANDVEHELRTPLTSLRANVDALGMLEGRGGVRGVVPERRTALEELRIVSDDLSTLVSEVVDLARGVHIDEEKVEVDIDSMVHHAVHLACLDAPRASVRIAVESRALVIAHATALQRAVTNLVRNAVQLSPTDEEVVVSIESTGERLEFRVADRGPGIPDAEKTRVFDRFYRGKARTSTGSGLGLAIVRQTAEIHGGGVGVEDRSGGGVVFTMWIPG